MLAHYKKYPLRAELTHMWISVTCGGGDLLMYINTQTSHQSEILHSLIFIVGGTIGEHIFQKQCNVGNILSMQSHAFLIFEILFITKWADETSVS